MCATRTVRWIVLVATAAALTLNGSGARAAPAAEAPDPPKEPGLVQPSDATAGATAMFVPPLSTYLNIKIDDDINNMEPAVAYNSRHDEYLVVWENDRPASSDIYAQRVKGDGTLLTWFCVMTSEGEYYEWVDVAYSPAHDEYLIVYTHYFGPNDYDIWGRRVKWNGADLGLPGYQPFPINYDPAIQWHPAVTYNSQRDEYLVVYENAWSTTLHDIDAQRVRASDGAILGPASGYNVVTAPDTIRVRPDVAYNSARDEYLIAYSHEYGPGDYDIRGKIASANFGTLSDEIHIAYGYDNEEHVALAAGLDEFLAVWSDEDYALIAARRVTGAGAPQSHIHVAGDIGQLNYYPAVAYGNAYGYLVTWSHWAGGLAQYNLYSRLVPAGGDTPSTDQFDMDTTDYNQLRAAMACGFTGQCLVVYEDGWPGADHEIRGRFVLAYPVFCPLVVKN